MHVPVLRQTDACCHDDAGFDKRRRNSAIAGVVIAQQQ